MYAAAAFHFEMMPSLQDFLLAAVQRPAFVEVFLEHDGQGKYVHPSLKSSMIRQELQNRVSGVSMNPVANQCDLSLYGHLQVLVKGTWPSLTSLDLSGLSLTDLNIAQLSHGRWPLLKFLNLSRSQLDSAAVQHLTKVHLPQLETLDLSWNWLDDQAIWQLQNSNWSYLQHLNLRFNMLRTEGIACLTRCSWPMLKSLNLRSNFIDGKAMDQLVQGKWLQLMHLDLRTNRGAYAQKVTQSPWSQLKSIALDDDKLDSTSMQLLLKRWPQLQTQTKQMAF